MGSSQASFFKRRFARARMGATAFIMRRVDDCDRAIVVADDGVECFGPLAVENVGAGGALVLGGTGWSVGQTVELELQLKPGLRVRARAVVVRLESHRSALGVALQFQDLPRATEDAIQAAVWEAIVRPRMHAPKVIAVTPWQDDARPSWAWRPALSAWNRGASMRLPTPGAGSTTLRALSPR